jgi:hypothetical protein
MTRACWPALPLALLAWGCSGESLTTGLTEPLRIDGAQFRAGKLPGIAPEIVDENPDAAAGLPSIVGFSTLTIVPPGAVDRGISGTATVGSYSVGLRFADLGSGYWVLPTTNIDLQNTGEIAWGGSASYLRQPTPGKHRLLAVAFDEQGRAGAQAAVNVCLQPEVPDNGNACDATKDPPKLVVSLGWNTSVDLDLRVVVPGGKVVDAKRPTTGTKGEDGKLDLEAAGIGRILQDSNAGCDIDGQQRESLVFQDRPPAGKYLVYANLFEACDQPSVEYTLTIHSSVPADDGLFRQAETLRKSGGLQAVHANSGASLGTFITQFAIE